MRTIYESTLVDIEASVLAAVDSQVTSASNDTLAAIAWEAFVDACDCYDIPVNEGAFNNMFPVYAELV